MALALRGVEEEVARRHSPEWVQQVFKQINEEEEARGKAAVRLERQRARLYALIANLAVAAVFDEKGEAASMLDDLREELGQDPEEDEEVPWLLNPEAKGYDLDAIRAAGINVQSVPAPADTTAQEATP